MYELKINNYQGPLDKLLELIEERKMEIAEVSLAAVTDDFLKYLEVLRAEVSERGAEEDLRLLADFIVVASRLILIKSKSLLPDLALTEEEKHDIQDLETRLAIYQKLKQGEKHVAEAWRNGELSAARPYLALSDASIFYPGSNVSPENLLAAIENVFQTLQKFTLATQTIKETIISLEEKMQDIVKRMQNFAETTLRTLGGGSRLNMILSFLAILHLAREQVLTLEQSDQFSDIIVRKNAK